jgi:hypothetical protein
MKFSFSKRRAAFSFPVLQARQHFTGSLLKSRKNIIFRFFRYMVKEAFACKRLQNFGNGFKNRPCTMTPAHFTKNLFASYRAFFRLFYRTFFRSRNTQARLTPKRFLVMAGFMPLLFFVQTMHWLGFLLDEIFFRGYRSVTIDEPVFIVGVPRSGTTFLHRLLAEDRERFTTFALWELVLAPSVAERKFWLLLARLDRFVGAPFARLIGRVERGLAAGLEDIHRISLTDEEEDYFLLVPVFACFLLILPFPFPDEMMRLAFFDDQVPEGEKNRIMDFYRSCLKRHLYVKGRERPILSKNVSFSPMIQTLGETFPDCRIVATVRNPLEAVASHISSMMAGAAVFDNDTRGHAFRDQMIAVQRYAYTHIKEAAAGVSRDEPVTVRMEDLKSDLAGTIEDLYERLGFSMAPGFSAYIREQDVRQKSYKSGHSYSLSSYGLSPEMIFEEFSGVFETFDYPRPRVDSPSS